MPEWQRFVFDSSTIIGAALSSGGKPRRALVHAALRGELLASAATFAELTSRLERPKFDRYLDAAERADFLEWLEGLLAFVTVESVIAECRDPKDDMFLELVVDGKADVLISSDGDLLALHPFRGIPILTAAQFLDAL